MAPKLYKIDWSPPVRSVFLTSKALDITLEEVELDVENQEHLKPEFLKLNPQHTVPTLEDEGKIIWDSHAIMVYLVSKYGKDDSLYPKDPYQRAVIDQRLHFDSGVMFSLIRQIVRPMIHKGVKTVPQDLVDEVVNGYDFLNKFLEGQNWVAGNKITLADFSLLTSVTSLDLLVPLDASKFPNVNGWIKRAQQLPYYNSNQKGLDELSERVKKLKA